MSIAEATRPGLDPDVPAIVHEELDRLPDRHRLPVVLCDLEGLTYEQAAGAPALDRADAAAPAGPGPASAPGSVDPRGAHGGGGRGRPGRVGGRGEGGGPRGPGPRGGRGGDGRGEPRRRPPP